MSSLVNRNVTVAGGTRSGLRLEPELWSAFDEVCCREQVGHSTMVRRIMKANKAEGTRTSAVRVFLFNYFRNAATEAGHAAVGHGRINDRLVATNQANQGLAA